MQFMVPPFTLGTGVRVMHYLTRVERTLLERFDRRTGCPILLNTSFNMRGEPIVCTPVDAITCFVRSGIDTLVLQDFVLDRSSIPVETP